MRVVRSQQAIEDIIDIICYLRENSPPAAKRFRANVRTSLQQLASNPLIGRPDIFDHPKLQDIRRWSVRGFPNYLIYYRVEQSHLLIIRILHGARDVGTTMLPAGD